MLVVITAAFGKQASEILGKNVLKQSYWDRFCKFVEQDIQVKGVTVGPAKVQTRAFQVYRSVQAADWRS